jgi:hypothetical protein
MTCSFVRLAICASSKLYLVNDKTRKISENGRARKLFDPFSPFVRFAFAVCPTYTDVTLTYSLGHQPNLVLPENEHKIPDGGYCRWGFLPL